MTTLQELAEKVLATNNLNRCQSGFRDDLGDYEEGACEAKATHRITSPHEDRHWDYCEACARKIHDGIEYNHRWSLSRIPEVAGIAAARALAEAVLQEHGPATIERVAKDVVWGALLRHPWPWHIEEDWSHEVRSADGYCVARCMSAGYAQNVLNVAKNLVVQLTPMSGADD